MADVPTNPATLATPPGAYLWRHYRFEFPLPGSADAVRLAPLLKLVANLANQRWDTAGRVKRALEQTQAACGELMRQLDSDDTLRGSCHPSYSPADLIAELTALDAQVTTVVMAVKETLSK